MIIGNIIRAGSALALRVVAEAPSRRSGKRRGYLAWLAVAGLVLALHAPLAQSFGTDATLYITQTLVTENGGSDCNRFSGPVPGLNYQDACIHLRVNAGLFNGAGQAGITGKAGMFRTSEIFYPNYNHRSGFSGESAWTDTLTIVSDLPSGTEVWLDVGAQVNLSFHLYKPLDNSSTSPSIAGQAWIDVATSSVNATAASVTFGGTSWGSADETYGDPFGPLGVDTAAAISRSSMLVKVGEQIDLRMVFNGGLGVIGPAWFETNQWLEGDISVLAQYAVSLRTAAPASLSRMSSVSEPMLDYIAASGTRYAASLPVPEPASWGLMLVGIGLVLWVANRQCTPGKA